MLARLSRNITRISMSCFFKDICTHSNHKTRESNGMKDLQNHINDVISVIVWHHEQFERYEALLADCAYRPVKNQNPTKMASLMDLLDIPTELISNIFENIDNFNTFKAIFFMSPKFYGKSNQHWCSSLLMVSNTYFPD